MTSEEFASLPVGEVDEDQADTDKKYVEEWVLLLFLFPLWINLLKPKDLDFDSPNMS